MIAPTRRIDEIGSGIPLEEIYSTVFSKSFILPGIAEINIAEIDNLEKKSKQDLILLFFSKYEKSRTQDKTYTGSYQKNR
jgi:hypothetical protein